MDKRVDKVGVVISFLHLATLKLALHILDSSILVRSRKRIDIICCFLDEPRRVNLSASFGRSYSTLTMDIAEWYLDSHCPACAHRPICS